MKFPGWNILMMRGGKTQILNRSEADLKAYLKVMRYICRVKNLYLKHILYTHTDKIKGTQSFAEWELIRSASVWAISFCSLEKS